MGLRFVAGLRAYQRELSHVIAQANGPFCQHMRSLAATFGRLYGTTSGGGANGESGTVFSLTASDAENVLHSFGSGNGAKAPGSGVTAARGTLYGTTFDAWQGWARNRLRVKSVSAVQGSARRYANQA